MRRLIFSTTVAAAVASIGLSPGPRQGHCLVYDSRMRRMVLLGGYQSPNPPALEEVWRFDGEGWGRLPGTGPAARSLCGAAYDSRRDRVILFGGVGNNGYTDLKGDTWEWDGESWRQATDTTVGDSGPSRDGLRLQAWQDRDVWRTDVEPVLGHGHVGMGRRTLVEVHHAWPGRTGALRDGVRQQAGRDGFIRRTR